MTQDQPPLYVDLDGTLLRSDLLWEGVCALARRSPLTLLALPLWLARGKAHLKARLADRVAIDAARLPVHGEFLEFLRGEHAVGRRIVAASASHRAHVEAVAARFGFFDDVLATEGRTNLAGHAKRDAILQREQPGGFDYAGNGPADIPVWGAARRALLVHPRHGIERAAAEVAHVERVFDRGTAGARAVFRTVRIHQWLKNVLVFVPLIAAHRLTYWPELAAGALAFLAFGLCASGGYIANDLLDLEADRRHPRKRLRPFASGEAPLAAGLVLAPSLLAAGLALSLWLPGRFALLLSAYVVVALAYSYRLKRVVLLDVLLLAGFYALRVLAGAAAVAVRPSFWLLAFSMFLFLSLALVKRASELAQAGAGGQPGGLAARGRDYQSGDLDLIRSLGAASGYLAVLVLALYINSADVVVLYHHPATLWLLCPLLLYWIGRVWLVTARGQMHDDPVLFALKDRVSWSVGVLAAAIVLLAT